MFIQFLKRDCVEKRSKMKAAKSREVRCARSSQCYLIMRSMSSAFLRPLVWVRAVRYRATHVSTSTVVFLTGYVSRDGKGVRMLLVELVVLSCVQRAAAARCAAMCYGLGSRKYQRMSEECTRIARHEEEPRGEKDERCQRYLSILGTFSTWPVPSHHICRRTVETNP
ncbi:hypothetical protein GE09DRAFT_1080736 [Coniochaeta sp. 2T2.1]|nr:hypothetical protein GE09DRAFT_1080736 [Coniochaeta sp. 2T2.1]